MYYPSKKEYLIKAKSYNLIPVYGEYIVDTETPSSIFMKAGGPGGNGFLLESIEGAISLSRYSFTGIGCRALISFNDGTFTMECGCKKKIEVKTKKPLEELEKVMSGYRLYKNPELNHFTGGAVGYLGYDLIKYFENVQLPGKKSSFPEMMLYLTDSMIVFDHMLNRMKIISTVKIDENLSPEDAYAQSIEKIESIQRKICEGQKNNMENIGSNFFISDDNLSGCDQDFSSESNFTKESFLEAVEKAKKYITCGEAFQIVLSQRFSTDNFSNSFNIYRGLRTINPSPYMYYMNFGDFEIIGSSPEPLVKINGRKVLTRPIAGTRKRGKTSVEDMRLADDLLNDEKERAEHNMLVDLSRNDLGRVCRYGSVKVKKYMSVEKYSHVMHLVSEVEGILDKNKTVYDALRSAFPAGTLSGAPKIRAMQIISEFEPDCRGPYGGVVGYFGYDGSLDSCITIRTALVKGGRAYIQAGAGIVYDSIPENEWNETVNKASALFKAIRVAGNTIGNGKT